MSGAARISATPAGVTLGPLHLIDDGAARNFVVQTSAGRFHGFALRDGDTVTGFVDRCPHAGLPLARVLDDYLTADGHYVACAWHGALFDRVSGRCVGGPCVGATLATWPLAVIDGHIVTQ